MINFDPLIGILNAIDLRLDQNPLFNRSYWYKSSCFARRGILPKFE